MLALAALIIMSSGWFQRVLERRVIDSIQDLTGTRVEVGYFRFRPWLFQITMQKLVIHGAEPANEGPLISARVVEAGLSPTQLLRRRLRLRYLDTDGLEIHILTSPQGVNNLPIAGGQASSRQGLAGLTSLSIGRLSISHAVFYLNDQRQALQLDARDLAILISNQRGRYHGSLSSSATTIRVPQWSSPPIKFNSRFDASPDSLAFPVFAWQATGTSGEASFTILPRADMKISGSFRAVAELPWVARLAKAPQLRAGELQCEGTGVWEGGALALRGHARVRKAVIAAGGLPLLPVDATASYAWEKHQLSLSDLQAGIWGGSLQGTLQADFQGAQASFQLKSQIHQVRLEDALRAAAGTSPLITNLHPVSRVGGALNATWSERAEALKADFDLSFEAPSPTPRNSLPVTGTASGTLERDNGLTLRLIASQFRTPHSNLAAQGTLAERATPGTAADPLAFTVSTDQFAEWQPLVRALTDAAAGIPLQLKSRAQFSGRLDGSLGAPSLQGRISAGEFQYQGWEWDRLAATLALSPSFVQVTDGQIQRGGSSFELNASAQLDQWQVTPGSMIRFSAHAQKTPIEGLKAAINSNFPLSGSLTGRLDVEGTKSTLTGSGIVRMDSGTLEDEPFDSLSAQLQVSQAAWKFQNIRFAKGRGRVTGDIAFDPVRQFASGHLEGTDFRVSEIRHLSISAASATSGNELQGSLSFEARGQGNPDDFHLQCPWRVRNLSVRGTALGEIDGTLTGEGKQLILQGVNQSPAGSLHFEVKATAGETWPMAADGQYSGVRADPWFGALLNREFGAQVTLSGDLHAEGPLRAPQKIQFNSRLREVSVNFPSVQWQNTQPVDVRYLNGTLTLGHFLMRGPSTELGIEGTVDFRQGTKLALEAEGTANATVLMVFDPKLQAAGRSILHLRLSGTPQQPLLNGSMDIQELSVGYSGLPFGFNGMQGTIQLEGERAVIRSLRGTSSGGTVSLGGFVTLAANPRYDLTAQLRQLRMRYPPLFTSVFDGNLRLLGDTEQAQVLGELVVHQMVLNDNVSLIAKIIESTNPVAELPVSVNSPIASKVRLNIRVTSNPPVHLQTPNLRLAGDIDMRIQGTVADPVQVGTIHLLSGETVFRGNRYTLVRGDMNMTNPFRTLTYLDVEAETQVQNYNLILDMTGPFDRLKISYRSDPPLAQTDIISLLALGYVPQEQAFPALQGNPTSSIGASAILSQALSSQIGGRIQHLFGVSRIKIDPDVGMPGLSSGERVTVEEQITHDLTLTYITDTAYSQYTIVQFELNVGNNMSILGVRDPNGVFGIEFRFHHQFK